MTFPSLGQTGNRDAKLVSKPVRSHHELHYMPWEIDVRHQSDGLKLDRRAEATFAPPLVGVLLEMEPGTPGAKTLVLLQIVEALEERDVVSLVNGAAPELL